MLALLLFGDTRIDPDGHVHIADVLVNGLYLTPELSSKMELVQLDSMHLDTSTHRVTIGDTRLTEMHKDSSRWNDIIHNTLITYMLAED